MCYSARRFNADRRANPLRSLDSGGSNFRADQQPAHADGIDQPAAKPGMALEMALTR